MTDEGLMAPPPSALERFGEIAALAAGRRLALFLDFDGTLAPIVARPELAALSESMRATLGAVAARYRTAIVSGRDLPDVAARVGLDGVVYAGSHGFDIGEARGARRSPPGAGEALPRLDAAERALRAALAGIEGALVERKRYSVAVHYRLVRGDRVAALEAEVDRALAARPGLRKTAGKKVFELLPDIDWDKGAAVRWLLVALGLENAAALPVYVGDDVTDEDALRALAGRGLGIAVLAERRPTAARYSLRDPEEVERFLERLTALP